MKRYDPIAERERLEKALHDLTNRMLEIGFMLDDDSISDSEFSRLEKEEIEVIAKIGKYQTRFDFLSVRVISNVSDWTAEFLESFGTGTRKVSNRQADCLRRVNNGKPFIYKGRRYDCRGANYRAGFGTLIITDLEETETTETETTETEQQEESNGIKWETIDGLATPCNLETVSADEISSEIERLKREAAPIDDAMEADNVPLEEWQEMRAESAALWEKIGVLQYVFYIPGAKRFQTERRFYNTESGDVLTLEELLLCWSQHKCLREGWPRFGWYVAACQTYQGGTLEEIR